jgi:D-serine deaminase-like pyridoxal phosphate-dependent protein
MHPSHRSALALDPTMLAELDTPALVVDLDRLHANLDRMAAYASARGLALRPHIKTHKSPRIAAEQLERGAVGLTCATVREAEIMADVCDDLLVAYPPVGGVKAERLAELPREIRLTVALDSMEAIEALAAAMARTGRVASVLIELDAGMHRVGVANVTDAITLARAVQSHASLSYGGITFYPGHIRQDVSEQDAHLAALSRWLDETVSALASAGLPPDVVSGGSTPTAFRTHELVGITEFRPGTYVYNDRTTAVLGACGIGDCALTVLATVVSTAVPGQAVIDAGSKALGREPLRSDSGDGFGVLLDSPDVTVRAMSEEHGILDLSSTSWRPRVGDRVRVIPNHVCVVVHLHDEVYGVRGEAVETSWPVAARGR